VRPQHGAHENRVMLIAVGVSTFVPLQHVQLTLRDLATRNRGWPVFSEVFARADVVVNTPDLLESSGGCQAVCPEEVEYEIGSSEGGRVYTAEAEGCCQ
jgi:hypothetical protein